MKRKIISLDFELEFSDIVNINKSFATGKCSIAYTGRNPNRSDISKESFERALPSLKNCPVVCNYSIEDNSIGGHDMDVVRNSKGQLVIINKTVPFGVIPESGNQYWEERNGKTYLITDIILWKRQPVYQYFVDNGKSAQSMEIAIKENGYDIDKDGYCIINDFEFLALCALGEDHPPCFEDASVQLFEHHEFTDYHQQFALMLDEMKSLENFSQNSDSREGENMELIEQILAEYGKTLDTIDFEITEEMTEEEIRSHFAEEKPADETQEETPPGEEKEGDFEASTGSSESEEGEQTDYAKFSALQSAKREALRSACSSLNQEEGNFITSFYLVDYDETYMYVEKGIYDMSDGSYVSEYGRLSYTFNDDTIVASAGSDYVKVINKWVPLGEESSGSDDVRGQLSQLQAQLDEYMLSHSHANVEFEELQAMRDSVLNAQRVHEIDEVLSEFDDLDDNAEFILLKENCYELDAEALRKECYAIRGKAYSKKSKIKTPSTLKYQIPPIGESNDVPYGGLVEKALNRQ